MWPTDHCRISYIAITYRHVPLLTARYDIIIHGLLCLRGNTIHEVGIEMTMSCSIHWVVVIDGSLYSQFYGMIIIIIIITVSQSEQSL